MLKFFGSSVEYVEWVFCGVFLEERSIIHFITRHCFHSVLYTRFYSLFYDQVYSTITYFEETKHSFCNSIFESFFHELEVVS